MEYKVIFNKIVTSNNKDADKKWYLAPLVAALVWIFVSIASLFTIDISLLTDPFVIFSVFARFAFPIYSIFFIKKFYYISKLKPINYNHMLNFIGYSISLTYVSYMIPAVVLDFYKSGASSPIFVIFVIIATLCPMTLYILLKNPNVKLATGFYNKDEVEKEIKRKKDKTLKKQYQKKLRRERTPLQNFWFEILDPLMWAILWVLIINNTVFQLYQIPSSSMVPQFLEQDRVVANKLFSGPRIPLTTYKLPELFKPKVGDIVTFNNPEVDNPESDLHYKNIFTRIFQPFVFMLSFSKLDIDTDESGNPKARQLVKRVIGVPGDKLCIVNDKVYKKTKDSNWTLMSDLKGQKEWGHNDLFSIDSKNSGAQFMNPELRSDLDQAANLALNMDFNELLTELKIEKSNFLDTLDRINTNVFLSTIESYNRVNGTKVEKVIQNIETSYISMMQVNRYSVSTSSKNNIVKEFNTNLDGL